MQKYFNIGIQKLDLMEKYFNIGIQKLDLMEWDTEISISESQCQRKSVNEERYSENMENKVEMCPILLCHEETNGTQ